jgi:hypothetical protein
MVEYELRNYATSIGYLEASLTEPRRPLNEEERSEAKSTLERARRYVARYTIRVTPPEATVRLDDAPVTFGPDKTVLLEVGDHRLVVQAPGYLTARETLQVVRPGSFTREIGLVREEATRGAGPKESGSSILSEWWFWGGVGAIVVGTTVGLAVGLQPSDEPIRGGTTGTEISVQR